MSQPSFESASPAQSVLTKKSAWNVYTVLLLISLIALLMAMLFFYLEIREYGGWGQVKGPLAMSSAPAAADAGMWA